ncbi:GAF domain-containing sensor histidine kinase [Thermoleptolyngbya sp. M55_K2018_002]|uniref:sensor histidine kinase n=1 Tax=Thermoleptolyngbya sp. M55_K2018_002 TaxID=2747808 RepID=UPI0025F1C1A5|nr:GAF domain-containing sensor histidine kinase [Thermoleptolyngbya sp. M55_K2018_002]
MIDSPFIPRGHCYLWKPELIGLHLISDSLIAIAYYSIPCILIYFVYRRRDLPYPWVFLLFSAFIVACGTTHVMEVWTLWHPTYWLSGIIKALTSGISVFTAIRLVPLVPQALEIPSPAQLEMANQELEREVLERLRIEEMMRQQAEREQLLGRITQHIRQSLDLYEILNTTVEEVRRFLRTDRVVVYQFTPDWNGNIIAESVSAASFSILGQTIHDPCFESLWQEPYQQGRVSAIADVYTANIQPCHRDLLISLQVRANLALPVLYGESLWGLLIAHHCSEPRHWESWEVDLLRQLLIPLNIAIQQAQLHQQIQLLNSNLEQQVENQTNELRRALEFESLLKRITDKVRDSLDEGQILQTAVEELALGLGVECCDVRIYDADRTACTIRSEYTTQLPSCLGHNFSISEPPARDIHEQILQGITSQFCFTNGDLFRIGQAEFSAMTCPLMDDEGVLGSLWLFKPKQQDFNELELRVAQQVANQCAIAVRQARLYQTAQQQVIELERLNRLKDDFLSTVSHELRTPMSSIKLAIQMLEIQLRPLNLIDTPSSPVSRYFQILQNESQREINLINDLLDLARIDADVEPLALTTIDLREWLPHLAEPFELQARSQQQQLQLAISEALPAFTTDLAYLSRILSELLHNACKYTPAEGIITLSAWAEAGYLKLVVTNTGIEIPESELERIFDKFYRVPSLDPWRHGGTGLGLALAKKLVERLGGIIRAESANNQVEFIVEFPMDWLNFGPTVTV